MGKEKYQKKILELFNKSNIVSSNSIKKIIKNNGYYKQLIRNLILKNKIKKLTKGFYTIKEDPSLIVFSIKPAYLGLQDALSIHNLWEQETIPVVITTRKIRQGIRSIDSANILIKRINKNFFFGIDYIRQGDIYYPYSDIEKTFIDLIYFKQKIDKEIISNIKKRINNAKLKKYLKHYPKRIRKRVLSVIE